MLPRRVLMQGQGIPTKITLDAYAASHRAVADLKQSGELAEKIKKEQFKIGKFARSTATMPEIWQAALA